MRGASPGNPPTVWRLRRLISWEKNGSSGRTRTYNPPVNSCTNAKTAKYRQLRLILKTLNLRSCEERPTTADFDLGSLKKSPKYFSAQIGASPSGKKIASVSCMPVRTKLATAGHEGGWHA